MGSSRIHERMDVIGADGTHLGVVAGIEGCRIRLAGAAQGEAGAARYVALGQVDRIDGERVRLAAGEAVLRDEER